MLHHLLDCLNPSRPEHRLADTCHLVGLTQGPTEGTAECMAWVRGFDARLNKLVMGEVINTVCLLGMIDHRYDGILSGYAAGDIVVVTADLTQLESLMMGEDERNKILGLAPTSAPIPAAAQRASEPPRSPLLLPRSNPRTRVVHPTGFALGWVP